MKHNLALIIINSGLLNKDDLLFLEHFSPTAGDILIKKDNKNEDTDVNFNNESEHGMISSSLASLCWLVTSKSIF